MAKKKKQVKRRKPVRNSLAFPKNNAPKQKGYYVTPMLPGPNESWSSNV